MTTFTASTGPALLAEEPAAPWASTAAGATSPGAMALMGGRQLLKQWPQSRAELHATLVKGLPAALLLHLVEQLKAPSATQVADALGISARTLRRLKDQPDKPLPADLASKAWQLAETLSLASSVLGSADAAQRWMARPALGLDGACPIALMRTSQGSELVTEFLGRLLHGVYN